MMRGAAVVGWVSVRTRTQKEKFLQTKNKKKFFSAACGSCSRPGTLWFSFLALPEQRGVQPELGSDGHKNLNNETNKKE
jgi:hypothetical protein